MTGLPISNGKRPADPADDESYSDSAPSSNAPSPSPSLTQRPFKRQAASEISSPPSPTRSSLQRQQVRDALPIVPTSVVTSSSYYGRINAENESNLAILEEVSPEMNHGRVSLPRRTRDPNSSVKPSGKGGDEQGMHPPSSSGVSPCSRNSTRDAYASRITAEGTSA